MKKLLLVSLLALWLWGCGKEEPVLPPQPPPEDYTKLPPETQEGKNTFGCMIYNQVWVPRVPIGSVTVVAKSAMVSEKTPEGGALSLATSFQKIHISTMFSPSLLARRTSKIVQTVLRFLPNISDSVQDTRVLIVPAQTIV